MATGEVQFKELPIALKLLTEFGNFNVRSGLAIGRCCEVYEGIKEENGEGVAVKVFKRHQQYHGALHRELQFLTTLTNPLVVKHYGHVEWEGRDILVQELLGPTLRQILLSHQESTPSIWLTLTVSRSLLRGLSYLHSQGCIHGDIKPPNILWDPGTCTFKLIDFGVSYNVSENLRHTVQSTGYQSPECKFWNSRLKGNAPLPRQAPGKASDIWSAGCVIAECMLGGQLFPGNIEVEDLDGYITHKINSTTNQYHHIRFIMPAYNFITKCIRRKPDDRCTAQQLLRDPWLKGNGICATFHDLLLLPMPVLRIMNFAHPYKYLHREPPAELTEKLLKMCEKYGEIESHYLDKKDCKFFAKFKNWMCAENAQEKLNDIVFDERNLVCSYYPSTEYEAKNFNFDYDSD